MVDGVILLGIFAVIVISLYGWATITPLKHEEDETEQEKDQQ